MWPLKDAQCCCFSTFILTHSCHISILLMSSLSLPPPSLFFIFLVKLDQECLFRPCWPSAFPAKIPTCWKGQCFGKVVVEGEPTFLGPSTPMGSCQQVPPALLSDQMWVDEGVGLCCVSDFVHHCAVPIASSAKPALHSHQDSPYGRLLRALLMDLRHTAFSQDENNFSRPLLSISFKGNSFK